MLKAKIIFNIPGKDSIESLKETSFLIILVTNCMEEKYVLTVSFGNCSIFPKGLEPGKIKCVREREREREIIQMELSSRIQIEI